MEAYLDNAATTKPDEKAVKALGNAIKKYGNPSSLHYKGIEAAEFLEKSRFRIANSLDAKPNEIIFTSSGTEADNLAILGLMLKNPKKHVITAAFEHHAVLDSCKWLQNNGYKVTYIKPNINGFINPEDIRKAITKDTCLVSVMHANNEIGTIQPIEEISKICKQKDIPFHTDAVQSYKKTKLDPDMADLISISAHKIHGLKGAGALYVKEGVELSPLLYGGMQEKGIRPGTENIPAIAAFAETSSLEMPLKQIKKLRDTLAKELLKIKGSKINGSMENRICSNLNIRFERIEAESLMMHLSSMGIAVSMGSACVAKSISPSHVLKAIGLSDKEANSSIRISLSKYTTAKEINYAAHKIRLVVESLRKA